MQYSLSIALGLLPSIIWLLYFLRKDHHPEPNKMILKVFFYGMIIAVVAALVEIAILGFLKMTVPDFEEKSTIFFILYNILGIAFIEEFLKYIVVKQRVLHDPAFDEPVDAMLYMIISALGFAALENILVLLPGQHSFAWLEAANTSVLRFAGATFLHALCSGTVGYFLALAICRQNKTNLIIMGLMTSTLLHGIFNLSIIGAKDQSSLILIPIIILIALALFVSLGFRHLKKILSTCRIK